MASKQAICWNVLKKHGLLIDYSGRSLGKVPTKKVNGETFKQWKDRVLGPNVTDVTVYYPESPAPQTRMSTLEETWGGDHVKRIFTAFERRKDRLREEEVQDASEEAYETFATVPKETLQEVLESLGNDIEPPLQEMLERFLSSSADDIDTSDLLRELLDRYNNTVRMYRQASG